MKMRALKCPECNANLEIEDNLEFCFCKYCGCQIFVDDEKQEHTINKNININKSIHERYTDDADVIRAKTEAGEGNREFKQALIVWGIIIALFVAIILGFQIHKVTAQRAGKVKAGYYEDLIGKDYEIVKAHFEAAGFTNIQLIDLDNSGIAFWTNGRVVAISVGGDTEFESTDWFYPDTKVVISYK